MNKNGTVKLACAVLKQARYDLNSKNKKKQKSAQLFFDGNYSTVKLWKQVLMVYCEMKGVIYG